MSKNLRRINLDLKQKAVLEKIAGRKIYLRNNFGENQNSLKELQDQAKMNAIVYHNRQRLGQKLSILEENNLYKTLLDIQSLLRLKKTPLRIECYDISHISGKFAYGSMVTFVNGKPAKKFYRLFKVKEQNNDFANLQEVLKRRIERSLKTENENWRLPDLIVIDGGKGQLGSVARVFEEYENLDEVEICSLAKKEEEVFTLGDSEGKILEGQVKFMFQRIRDEAHRFAIKNNRKARIREVKKSELDKIDGIGSKTKEKLLSVFGSVENLVDNIFKNPSLVEEIAGKSIFGKLKKHFGFK